MKPNAPRLPALLVLAACLCRTPQSAVAADPAPPRAGVYSVTERLDMEMVKRHANFGYTDEEIRKYFDYPQVFDFDADGLAAERLKAPPAPGAHPRVFFRADDLPALRRKLARTKPGKLQMDGIRTMLRKDLTGADAKFAALYDAAVRGDKKSEILDVRVACPIVYECFRCLIDDDEAGGKKAAAALTTLAELDAAALDEAFAQSDKKAAAASPADAAKAAVKPPLRDFQETSGLTQNGLLALGYDFAYPWLTADQRDAVRRTLAKASAGMSILCAEGLPAFPANTSNWIPMHMRLILICCAIEGEEGSDPQTYRRCVAGYKRYLSVGLFPAGDTYESMGKNFLCAENLIPVANRGNNLLALKRVRAQIGGYYLHAMDPWGGHFTFYDSLGGRGNTTPMFDVLVVKHLFPKDPAIDFVYRNTVGEDYESFARPVAFGHPFFLMTGLVQAIFAEEYAPKSWDQARADAAAGKPLTFFSEGTGNLITRDAWDKDAVQLHFLTRCVSGGHQYADRTHFSLHALGRYWAIYKPLRQQEEHYQPKNRSVILIDGQGPGMAMARCAALDDAAGATFIAADAKPAYEWNTGGNDRFPKGGQRVPFVANDFRLHKSDLPWMDLPWSDLPNWQTSSKGSELWLPLGSVRRAFRTAGLVRGAHPYVLIVDDFQKDDDRHDYQWGMILEDDLVRDSTAHESSGGAFRDDAILGEKGKSGPGARFLLVRVLNAEGRDPAVAPAVEQYELPNTGQKPIEMHRLEFTCKAVAPDFKTLLFPYRDGQELPRTTWDAGRTRLIVEWGNQKDTVTFTKGADGRTRIAVARNGEEIGAAR